MGRIRRVRPRRAAGTRASSRQARIWNSRVRRGLWPHLPSTLQPSRSAAQSGAHASEAADGAALLHLHNVSGGLLGGDELSLSAKVGPGSDRAAHSPPAPPESTGHERERPRPPRSRTSCELTGRRKTRCSSTSPIPSFPYAERALFAAHHDSSCPRRRAILVGKSWPREGGAHGEVFQYEMRGSCAPTSPRAAARSVPNAFVCEPHAHR